jgi:DNA polymerase-1
MEDTKKQNILCLIDGSAFIFRAFHSLPPMYNSNQTPVNAVYGFAKMLAQSLDQFPCSNIVVIFDHGKKTFRNDIYPNYKAQRPPLPQELAPQFNLIYELVDAFNITRISQEGYEADDIIASYSKIASKQNYQTIIISSDKDLIQLLNKEIKIYDPMKKKYTTNEDVLTKFGVLPENFIDFQALIGDTSDNIPGVKGVGPKTASTLINEYKNLDTIYQNINNIKSKTLQAKLLEHKELAYTSKILVTLKQELQDIPPISELSKNNLSHESLVPEKLLKFYSEQNFKSLAVNLATKYKINLSDFYKENPPQIKHQTPKQTSQEHQKIDLLPNNTTQKIHLKQDLSTAISNLFSQEIRFISFNIQNEILEVYTKELGTYLITYTKETNSPDSFDFVSQQEQQSNSISQEFLYNSLLPIFKDASIKKIFFNYKLFLQEFNTANLIPLGCFDDLQSIIYLLEGTKYNLTNTPVFFQNYFQTELQKEYPLSESILILYHNLLKNLILNQLYSIYENIDKPLILVLFNMEQEGITISKEELSNLTLYFEKEIQKLSETIYQKANKEFNIGSPKQIGEVLFEELKLKGKKNKSGSWKTESEVLEELNLEGHTICGDILTWRQFSKLKSTYSEGLKKHITPLTSKIHTTYLATHTSTGRLSSIDPNLQNIPIKTEEGKKIRQCFIPSKNNILLSLDYSQIELRILSHIANIESLKQGFANNLDIHSLTASEIFNIPLQDINQDLRRKAKAINFGIIYGLSAFGLAKQINVSNQEASIYIKNYFEKYSGIKKYMDETTDFVKKNLFVYTLFNRKCFFPDINHPNHLIKQNAERAAINARIQGTASDIMRKAMNEVFHYITTNNLNCKLLLQIHDELLLELPNNNDKEEIALNIKNILEKTVKLNIPLTVNYNFGKNWLVAH